MQGYQRAAPQQTTRQDSAAQQTSSARAPRSSPQRTGDPATPDKIGDSDTQHAALGMDDCTGAPAHQNPTAVSLERDVQVVASIQKPLVLPGAAAPAESELFLEREASDQSEPGWDYVDTQLGTVAEPFAMRQPDPKTLYLDGGPRVDDIQQGQIGDCYFLAALTGIVAKDPSAIERRMHLGAGTVTVDFFRYDSSSSAWVPAPITVTDTLLHQKNANGTQGSLLSAGVVAAEEPSSGSWYADITETELSINADYLYATARWVALLEKAYAQYVERYGQYGGGPDTAASENKTVDDQGNALSGYEIMHGGVEAYIYPLFYGPDVTTQVVTAVQYTPGADLVTANEYLIWSLLMVSKTTGNKSYHLTCSTTGEDTAQRMLDEIAAVRRLPSLPDYGPAFTALLGTLEKVADAAKAGGEKEEEKLARKAAWAVAPGNWPVLDSDREQGAFRNLQELLLIAAQLGDDSGTGQRHVYADHAYAVTGATFLGADGKDAGVTPQNYKSTLASIDAEKSTVGLRNPHASNEPNPTGAPQEEDGRFTLSLEQFIRAFATMEIAGVKK